MVICMFGIGKKALRSQETKSPVESTPSLLQKTALISSQQDYDMSNSGTWTLAVEYLKE